MEFKTLGVEQFRNLQRVNLALSKGINVFTGENGAGKTSVLEACYFLSHGRSFRSANSHSLIRRGQNHFIIRSEFAGPKGRIYKLGVEKTSRSFRARIDGRDVSSQLECTRLLPILSIHPGTFTLLTGDRAARRAFLDWGCFYQNSHFEQAWRSYQRALKQRNAALRQGGAIKNVQMWDQPLVDAARVITQARQEYVNQLGEQLPDILSELEIDFSLDILFHPGWADADLALILKNNIERDKKLGYTYPGPHRADFLAKMNELDAGKFGSRGQIKIVTIVLMLAQAQLFREHMASGFILLLDDLAAELDQKNFSVILQMVRKLKVQSLISGLSHDGFATDDKVFHVEHGEVSEML